MLYLPHLPVDPAYADIQNMIIADADNRLGTSRPACLKLFPRLPNYPCVLLLVSPVIITAFLGLA